MAESPSTPTAFTVYCGGNKLNNAFSLVSASVHQALNSIGKATLKLDILKPEGAPAFDENDAQLFKPGNAIRLNVGEPGKEETLFDGIATGLSILKGNDQRSCITVECRDSDLPAKLNSNDRTSNANWLNPVLAVTYGKDITAIDLDFFGSDIAVVSEEIMALKQCTNDVVTKASLARYQGSCSFYGSAKVTPGSRHGRYVRMRRSAGHDSNRLVHRNDRRQARSPHGRQHRAWRHDSGGMPHSDDRRIKTNGNNNNLINMDICVSRMDERSEDR